MGVCCLNFVDSLTVENGSSASNSSFWKNSHIACACSPMSARSQKIFNFFLESWLSPFKVKVVTSFSLFEIIMKTSLLISYDLMLGKLRRRSILSLKILYLFTKCKIVKRINLWEYERMRKDKNAKRQERYLCPLCCAQIYLTKVTIWVKVITFSRVT